MLNMMEVRDVNELDGILYSDIKEMLHNKEILENILFTTKIMFVNNEELIEFMNKLTSFGYNDIALDYVENLYDKVVLDFSDLKFNENNLK